MRLHGHGLRVDLPHGWEGLIYRRRGEATLHAANFALPPNDGDFATKALSHMDDRGVLLVVTEFDPSLAGRGLYDNPRPEEVSVEDFDPATMQKMIRRRAGVQRFFTARHRAFCLYSVVATGTGMRGRVAHLNRVIGTLHISRREA